MSNRVSFDLVSEPWIDVVFKNGKIAKVGIREALSRADEIICLADESSPSWLGTMRLLVAFPQRAVQPKTDREWVDCLRNGWDQKALDAYLTKWEGRCDLLDPIYPFMQGQRVSDAVAGPATKLTLVHAANTEKRLMNHSRNDDLVEFSPAQIAVAILRTQACAKSGGASFDINGEKHYLAKAACFDGANFCLQSKSLRETLSLALLTPDVASQARGPNSTGQDVPSWEVETHEPTAAALTREPRGYLDWLTWCTRRIRLDHEIVNGSVVVKTCRIQQGDAFDREGRFMPMSWSGCDSKGNALRHNPTRFSRLPAWHVVIECLANGVDRPPLTILQARRGLGIDPSCLGSTVSIRMAGVESESSGPILTLYNDEVTLPTRTLVNHEEVGLVVKKLVRTRKFLTKRMQEMLTKVLCDDRTPVGTTKTRIEESVSNSCVMDAFWSEAREVVNEKFSGGDVDWIKRIDAAAGRVIQRFTAGLGSSTKAIIGLAKAGV